MYLKVFFIKKDHKYVRLKEIGKLFIVKPEQFLSINSECLQKIFASEPAILNFYKRLITKFTGL